MSVWLRDDRSDKSSSGLFPPDNFVNKVADHHKHYAFNARKYYAMGTEMILCLTWKNNVGMFQVVPTPVHVITCYYKNTLFAIMYFVPFHSLHTIFPIKIDQ